MTRFLAVATAALLLPVAAQAAVRFEDWRSTSLQEVTNRAAREKSLVVLVVSQPDWCPPCIRLDKKWLKNPDDTTVSDITKNAIVLEVNGYDEPGASILRKHHVSFRGTPTTFVFAPQRETVLLGDAPLRGSIIGAPDDFPQQLAALVEGEDAVREIERRIDDQDENDRIQRARDLIELGDLLAARGDAAGSWTAYRSVRRLRYGGLTSSQVRQLQELKREAAWRQADTNLLRVRKDYPRAHGEIVAYENGFRRRHDEKAMIAYSKAWALGQMGRTREALRVLETGLPDDADGAETYLYFCFRNASTTALVAGERKIKEALWRWPEHRAAWLEARGRIERRQGRFADAERSFAEAVSLETDAETRLVYQGELEHVREEIAARREAAAKGPQDAHSTGGSGDGGAAGRVPRGLGR